MREILFKRGLRHVVVISLSSWPVRGRSLRGAAQVTTNTSFKCPACGPVGPQRVLQLHESPLSMLALVK